MTAILIIVLTIVATVRKSKKGLTDLLTILIVVGFIVAAAADWYFIVNAIK